MLTGKTFGAIAAFLLIAGTASAQTTSHADSVDSPFERFWTQPRTVPKFGVGVQDRAFFEVDYSTTVFTGIRLGSLHKVGISRSMYSWITRTCCSDRKPVMK